MLDDGSRMVLINAVYFKGKWESPFNPIRTIKMPFYTDQLTSTEIPFMNQETHYGYANLEDLQAQIIELPYQVGNN